MAYGIIFGEECQTKSCLKCGVQNRTKGSSGNYFGWTATSVQLLRMSCNVTAITSDELQRHCSYNMSSYMCGFKCLANGRLLKQQKSRFSMRVLVCFSYLCEKKQLIANFTTKKSIFSLSSHMRFQTSCSWKQFIAKSTIIRSLSSVSSHVHSQMYAKGKRCIANCTTI